jgi:cysteine desulfurase/selenocysteine lyase
MSSQAVKQGLGRAGSLDATSRLDLGRIRQDFPILRQKVNGKPLVYLDNASTSQKPRAVVNALRHYYEKDNANIHRGVHVLAERSTEAYDEARLKVQRFLGAGCLREIIFTRGCTESINLVAASFGRSRVREGDDVLVTWMEHHSNIVPWQLLCQEKKAHLRVVPVTDAGELRLEELEKLLTPKTKILALTHVSNSLGTVNPVKEIVALAHRRGVPVLVDGAQGVAHLPVNVRELDCDFYAFSGHKVFGPTGIGVLYGKAQYLELMPPYQGGGDMIHSVSFEKTTWNELPFKFEAGTPNIAGAVGLGAALDYLEEIGRAAVAEHDRQLLSLATERLAAIPGVRLIGTAPERASVVSFIVAEPPLSALDVGTRLDLEGIAIRSGHHCCQPLMERLEIAGTARASFALYNTAEEVEAFADTLARIVAAAGGRPRAAVLPGAPGHADPAFPTAAAPSPQAAADLLAEDFDLLGDWEDRHQYLLELGDKLLPMPAEMKIEANRVHGCQSIVFMQGRLRPGTDDVMEFLAESDAAIVRGLIALLQRVFSGQRAAAIMAFDTTTFFKRLGLDSGLILNRRVGLDAMVKRIRGIAATLAERR